MKGIIWYPVKLLGFVEILCFASLPRPVSVGGIMQDASVT